MNRFSQQDPRWKDKKLGKSSLTLGYAGCLVTSLAMGCAAKGYSETPASLNQKMIDIGGFDDGLVKCSLIGQAIPGMKFIDQIFCTDTDAPIELINSYLLAGRIVIVLVDYDPDKAGRQDHWVVLERQAGDDYLIKDPYPLKENGGVVMLMERFGKGKTLEQAICGVVVIDSDGSTPTSKDDTAQAGSPIEEESPIPLQEGGQNGSTSSPTGVPVVGEKWKVVTNMVNERLLPGLNGMDVGDLVEGNVVEVLYGPVVVDGIQWAPIMAIHWVAMGKGSEVFLEKVL